MSVDEDMLYESLHESWNEIEELKAENTRLREQNRYLMKGDLLHWLTDSEVYEQQKREREMQASIKALDDENKKLRDLCEWLLEPYRLGAVTGEGVDKRWCRETYDGGSYRLRELGVEA